MAEDNELLFGDHKIPAKVKLKRLLSYIRPEWKSFLLAFIFILLNVGFEVITPLFIKEFTNAIADTSVALAYIMGLSIGYFIA